MSNIQEVNMFAVTPAIEQEWEQQAQNIKETRTKEEAVEYLEYERTVARVQRAFLLSDGYVTGAGAISSECYEKYINYLTALIQSKETEQETPPAPQETHLQFTPAETTVMTYYPQFGKDFQKLIDGRCMKRIENGLQWLYSKQSLAEYFKSLPKNGRSMHWQEIEILFDVKNLKAAASTNGNWRKKTSKDYMKLKELLTEK